MGEKVKAINKKILVGIFSERNVVFYINKFNGVEIQKFCEGMEGNVG